MRRILCFVAAALLLACTRPAGEEEPAPPGRLPAGTSLLLVTLDTTRPDFLTPYGAAAHLTPNLARLAASGSLFVNAFAQTNVTNPSHVSIFTGLPAIRHRVFHNAMRLPAELDTLAGAFQRAGFETGAFPAVTHVGEGLGWKGFDVLAEAKGELTADVVTGRLLDWLGKCDGSRPFFAWIHYWDPHTPYTPPAAVADAFYDGDPFAGERLLADRPFLQKTHAGKKLVAWLGERRDPEFPRAMYAAEIHYTDQELGRLLAFLDERGLAERTAIVVVADHGESLGEHEIYYDHVGLFEPSLRIPLIVRLPGFPAGRRPEVPVSQIDLAPTIEELFGVELAHPTDGLSLLPVLAGDPAHALEARKALVHEHAFNHQVAIRSGAWKLIRPITRAGANPALLSEDALFRMPDDPAEERNLAAAEAEVVTRLAGPLEPWLETGRVERGRDPGIDEAALEHLRALGYIQ